MSRRGGQLPWGSRRPGSFGQRNNNTMGRPIVLGAIVLAAFALAYFLLAQACGTSSCDRFYCATDQSITVPEGYERVTPIFEHNEDQGGVPEGQDIQIQLPLDRPTTDARNLSFYQYTEETGAWEPVAPAVLDPGGEQVTARLTTAPAVLTVLRRLSAGGHIVAYLGHNAPLHPDAAGQITILHTRDFKPTADGTLSGTPSTVQPSESVAWYPSIWADSSEQGLIPIVTGLLSSPTGRSSHVQHILRTTQDLGLAGVDIAYLDLPPSERTSFTLFVAELAGALHGQGKILTLTLPVPVRTADGIDSGAYDWAELGKSADVLQIRPYRDQSKYRREMPEILQALAGMVEPSKLVLTVSPYATEGSSEGIRTMSLTDAMVIATKLGIRGGGPDQPLTTSINVDIVGQNIDRNENLTGMIWSPETASVAFTYRQSVPKTVWIENVFSVAFKLEMAAQAKLGGVAVEDASANELLGNIWPALIPYITTGQPVLLQPNPQDLVPQWEVSAGTKEGGTRGVLRWVTPAEPGTYTVTLRLSEGVVIFENEIPVTILPKERTPAANTPASEQ